ncbi:cytochrome P450 [Thraustotheca clavata]|uniref:Cytochrome P450 n=1 Tax=Thraustotheca clavata TaxID=74557 RepID=A0A1V9ZFP1_9STRA|nr:cytochrome P450 [Thraustotheca clavata]
MLLLFVGTIGLLLFLRSFILFFQDKYRIACALRRLPGPDGLPILGNLVQLGQHMNDLHLWKRQLALTFGPTYAIKVDCIMDGSIVTNKPANIEHILCTNCSNYVKPKIIQEVCKEVMGQSIFAINPDSPLWACQRKLMANMFSVNSFRKYMDSVFLQSATTTVDSILSIAQQGQCINIETTLLTLTTNIAFQIGFGRSVPELMTTDYFHGLFREAGSITANRFTRPWYKYFSWCMPSERRLKAVMKQIDGVLYDILAARKAAPATDVVSLDILSQLLDHQRRGLIDLNDKVIRDTMMTVMLAGRETVASGLLWIIYCISKHPEVESKLLKEVDCVTTMDYNSMAELTYMEAVMKETWRLYPPTPLELKAAVADDILPDGTFVPAGVNIEFSPFVMNRDPTRWKDAEKFVPERWLDENFQPTDFEYPVFNAGKRKCVGQRIAMLQTKFILCKLYQQLRFQVVDPSEPKFSLGISLFPVGGMMVQPLVRSKPMSIKNSLSAVAA